MNAVIKEAKISFQEQCRACGHFNTITAVRTSVPEGWDTPVRYSCAFCDSEFGEVRGFDIRVAISE